MADETTGVLLAFVQRTFASRLRPGEMLSPSSPLFSSQLIDSIGIVELLAFIEQRFGVGLDLTIEELRRLDTAANLAAYIEPLRRVERS